MPHYYQGDLDSLCGVYSLINAVNQLLPEPLNHYQSRQLFNRILTCINSRENKLALGDGMTINEVARVIKHVLCKEFPIKRYKPFHGNNTVKLNEYWHTLQAELNQPHSLAFIGISGRFNHWTIVQRITDHNLILNDSIGMRLMSKKRCVMLSEKRKRVRRNSYWLIPNKTYILKLK